MLLGEPQTNRVAFSHSQHAERNWDVTVCQMVTRSDCCVWQGGPLRAWKTSFLLVAGKRHTCRPASVQKHPHIRGNWKDPGAGGNNPVCFRLVGRARASAPSIRPHTLTLCWQHWITHSSVLRSLCVPDDPNTQPARRDHLICAVSLHQQSSHLSRAH